MIEFIAYYFLLFVFTQFSAFKKYRENTGFMFKFMITFISILVFVYTCYNIVVDENYFFKINIPDPNTRKIVLLIFIGTFMSFLMFFITKHIRKLLDEGVPHRGLKGIRGKRGPEGKTKDDCDPVKCKSKICNLKLLNHISKIYSDILIIRGEKGVSRNREISNNFLKNKIKLLCRSPQMNRYISKKGNNKTYDYITKIWGEWIYIIMKYQQGKHFIETDYLTDNDFDNMISKEDKKIATFKQQHIKGTPSKGLESPFDEIKKYDIWYWGEPASTRIKIKYKCDYGNKDHLKFIRSNAYTNIWRSKTSRQARLNICYDGKTEETYVPYLQKGRCLIKGSNNISIYRPKTVENKEGLFKPLGDVIIKNDITEHKKEKLSDIVPQDKIKINYVFGREGDPIEQTTLIAGDIKSPIDFKLKYKSLRNEGIGMGVTGFSIWEPIPPKGYICLGDVMDKTSSMTPPNKELYSCVPEVCVREIKTEQIWENTDVHSPISNCNADKEIGGNSVLDTDEPQEYRGSITFDMDTINIDNRLFGVNTSSDAPRKMFEIIPSGEPNSCFDKLNDTIHNNSKWIVNDKNSDKYSIHTHFENNL
jgi:hypothetical protein